MVPPLAYAVLYFTAIAIYFTYVGEAARGAGSADWTTPLLFILIGFSGLSALATGRMTGAVGTTTVGVASVCVVGGSLLLLGLGATSLPALLLSALLLGAGYMVGSSLLAIWTAQVAPDRPGDAFTVTLVVGAITSIAAPAAMGSLIPVAGLPTMLVAVAVASTLGAGCLAVLSRRMPVVAGRTGAG